MPDEQLTEDCDETVTETNKNEPSANSETDADQNSAPDDNNDQGSKLQCWNEFQGKWLTRGDAITDGSVEFDNIEDAITECDQLGDANCQGILVKTGRGPFKLRLIYFNTVTSHCKLQSVTTQNPKLIFIVFRHHERM